MQIEYGAKYDRNLITTQIAALIRLDVAKATKTGDLPKGLKVSVKTRYYSGGSSIDLTIIALPAEMVVINPEYVAARRRGLSADLHDAPMLSEAVRTLTARLDGMMQAYNYDGSDSRMDHFDVRFYGHCGVGAALKNKALNEAGL